MLRARIRPFSLILGILLVCLLSPLTSRVAYSFHFPWDQGHDTFTPEDPPEDPEDCDKCNSSGSPFVAATGAYRTAAQDITIRGRIPLKIARVYHSRDRHNGLLGHGWTFNYGIRLIEATDGVERTVILRRPNGQRDRFAQTDSGAYTPPPGVFETLTKNAGTFTLTTRERTTFEFDDAGKLTAIHDRNGNTVSVSYDAVGFLARVADDSGRALDFSRGANGKIETITDPANRIVRYDYDADGNLTSVTDRAGGVTQYTYDSSGNLTSIIVPGGNVATTVTYDSLGRVTAFTEDGERFTLSYFPAQRKVTQTDPQGNTRTLLYNDNGNVVATTDALGNQRVLENDETFNISGITDKNGNTTAFTYDDVGNVTSITGALGDVTTFTYEPLFNQRSAITDPLGNVSRFEYDERGNAVAVTDALGNVAQMSYDDKGQLITTVDALGNTTSRSYDASGNLIHVVDPLGGTTDLAYDAVGNIVSATDGEGRTILYEYNANDLLVQMTDALGGTTAYAYDSNSNLAAVTDARGNTTTFEYDDFDRLSRITNALGASKTLTYDARGNLASTTDAEGRTTTYFFDVLDRLTVKATPDNTITYDYDLVGNLLSVVDEDTSLDFTYDELNRLTRATTNAGGIQPATTISYSYDPNGNRTTLTNPEGGVTTYEFDELNRLARQTNPRAESTTHSYDAAFRRTQVGFANGTSATLAYDDASRLDTLTHQGPAGIVSQHSYSYDGVGNRIAVSELAGLNTYTYDAANRLIAATHPESSNPSEQFTYDQVGNRLNSHLSSAYIYDDGNRLLEDDTFRYTYDSNGNLTSKVEKSTGDTTVYAYDAEHQLVRVDLPDGSSVSYRYDGRGRRVERNVNGQIARYVYDGEDILFEYDSSNTVAARYTHGPGFDEPLAIDQGGQSLFYHSDGLGTIRHLTDASAAVAQSYTYDAFGQMVELSPDAALSTQSFTYTGREVDDATNLYYYRARYYDASIGRFVSEDPAGFDGGINFYVYVENNPVNLTDPLGRSPLDLSQCIRNTQKYAVQCRRGNTWACAGTAVSSGICACIASTPLRTPWLTCINKCLANDFADGTRPCWQKAQADCFWDQECCHQEARYDCDASCPRPTWELASGCDRSIFNGLQTILRTGLPGCS